MASKTPYHRMAVDAKDGAYIAGAAGLRGMTPKAFVEAELVPLARKIIRAEAPLESDYIPGPWEGREGIRYVSLEPAVFKLLNQAVAVEARHHRNAGRRGKFTLKQLTEKYLVPIAKETVRHYAREVEESQKKAA
jgi:hypothetical protein